MAKVEGKLGVDYVVLGGRGDDRLFNNGAMVEGDKTMHLSTDAGASTICGQKPDKFLLTYGDVRITCKKCIEVLKRRYAETDTGSLWKAAGLLLNGTRRGSVLEWR